MIARLAVLKEAPITRFMGIPTSVPCNWRSSERRSPVATFPFDCHSLDVSSTFSDHLISDGPSQTAKTGAARGNLLRILLPPEFMKRDRLFPVRMLVFAQESKVFASGRHLLHMESQSAVKDWSHSGAETLKASSWIVLTPRTVESTLSSCPSDMLALAFFLWCARQPGYFHGSQAFGFMVPVLNRLTGRCGSATAVMRELGGVGCPIKAQTYLILMRIYWGGGMFRFVLETFDEMRAHNYAPNTFARNIVLDVIFKIGSISRAFDLFKDILNPNYLTFRIAICNLCKLKDWLGVRMVLRLMLRQRLFLDDGAFHMVLACLQTTGRVMEVLQLVGFMVISGKQLTCPVWTILIDAYCQLRRVETGYRLFEKMQESGNSPSVVTYTTIIKRLLEFQMTTKAFHLLDFMLANGCKPDMVLFNVLIDFLCKCGKYGDAIGIFQRSLEWNLKPDSYTFASLMTILCASGNVVLIPKLISVLDISTDLVICNSFMNILCRCGFPYEAVNFYADMVDRGFVPDDFTFAVLLKALCKSGRFDEAVRVYHGILVNGCVHNVHIHTTIICGLIKGGKIHKTIGLLRRAASENYCLDVISYSVVIHGLFECHMFEEACALFKEMKQLGFIPTTCTYNTMLSGLLKSRKFDTIRNLLGDMAVSGVPKDCITYNIVINYLLKSHQTHAALHIFFAMCDSGVQPSKMTYLLLYKGLHYVHVEEIGDLLQRLKHYLEDDMFVDMEDLNFLNELLMQFDCPSKFRQSKHTLIKRKLDLEQNDRKEDQLVSYGQVNKEMLGDSCIRMKEQSERFCFSFAKEDDAINVAVS